MNSHQIPTCTPQSSFLNINQHTLYITPAPKLNNPTKPFNLNFVSN